MSRMDLHEIILPRQRATQSKEAMQAIMHRCNCGYVHRECHKYSEGGEGREKSIIYLLRYEGLSNILNFLLSLDGLVQDVSEETRSVHKAWAKMSIMLKGSYDRD